MGNRRKGRGKARRRGGSGRKKERANGGGGKNGKKKDTRGSGPGASENDERRKLVKLLAVAVVIIIIVVAVGWFLIRPLISDGDGNGVDRDVEFPEDEGAHDEPYEFWRAVFLLTSTADADKKFGISTTYTKNSLDFGGTNESQLLITDEGNVTGHEYYGRITKGELQAEEGMLNLSYVSDGGQNVHYWRQSQGFNYTYHGEMYGGATQVANIDLTMTYLKPPTLIGTNGKIFDPEVIFGTIFGYSQTRLLAQGTVVLEGIHIEVSGYAWIDHQWGVWSYTNKEYWQLQMGNGVDLSIFRLYDSTGLVYERFYTVGVGGQTTEVDDYQLENLKYVIAPADDLHKRCVPSKWDITSPSIDLDAQSSVVYQFSQVFGWEGTIHGSGTMDSLVSSGRGYALLHNPAIADPVIMNVTHDYQDPGFPTSVTADIFDGIPIVNATIYYNRTDNPTINSAPMTLVSGNEWSGEIEPQPFNKTINYWIVAFDLADKSVASDVYQYDTQ